jgi:hypothetical protein
MNITIELNIKAPELVKAIENISGIFPAKAEVKEQSASVEKVKPAKTRTKAEAVDISTDGSAEDVTFEDVRAKLTQLTDAGKKADVIALFSKFGASKLTEIPKNKLGELMACAEALL